MAHDGNRWLPVPACSSPWPGTGRSPSRGTGDGFVDDETDSRWNVLGEAVDGPLEGTVLEPVAHLDTFWFAWASFRPDTEIVP